MILTTLQTLQFIPVLVVLVRYVIGATILIRITPGVDVISAVDVGKQWTHGSFMPVAALSGSQVLFGKNTNKNDTGVQNFGWIRIHEIIIGNWFECQSSVSSGLVQKYVWCPGMDIVTHVMAPLYQLAWYYKLFCETIMWCTVLDNIAWHYLTRNKT